MFLYIQAHWLLFFGAHPKQTYLAQLIEQSTSSVSVSVSCCSLSSSMNPTQLRSHPLAHFQAVNNIEMQREQFQF